jgi:DnaD/phage-associated family protein|nr:MAG TPA: Replication initiation and membrane attachment [Caudoviricetes sp.]
MDKSSFLIYLDYEEQFNLLTDEQIGQLMRAIIKYEKTREIPQLNGIVKMAFSFIKTQLDRDREKYEARCEKNRENAKKGGRPRKNQKDNLKANGFNENQMDAKKPDDDKEDEEDNEEDIDNDLLLKKEKEEKLQQRFIECLNSFNINAISECIKYLDELPFEVIDYVLSKTSGIKCPNWNYANTILQDYVKRKIDSVEKIQAEESGVKNQKQDTSKVVDF